MEEDIKICKEKIDFMNKRYADEHGEDYYPAITITTSFNARTLLAFENILNRLEQLEKENKERKQTQIFIDTEDPEERLCRELYVDCLKEEIEQLEKENEFWKAYKEKLDKLDAKDFIFKHELENYISKSVIREKIEELEKQIDDLMLNGDVYEDNVAKYNDLKLKIQVLQELLGE